jgi:hypothetical protein
MWEDSTALLDIPRRVDIVAMIKRFSKLQIIRLLLVPNSFVGVIETKLEYERNNN